MSDTNTAPAAPAPAAPAPAPAISLSKGGNVSLKKELEKKAPGAVLTTVVAGLSWDVRATAGAAFDLDAQAWPLTASGKNKGTTLADLCFFNNGSILGGPIVHSGDETTGAKAGDDETITVQLDKLPADVEKVLFTVTIHDAVARKQNFGMVSKAAIHVVDKATGVELAKYDLSEDASVNTALIFGELYKKDGEWKFRAVGDGFPDYDLAKLCAQYGITV